MNNTRKSRSLFVDGVGPTLAASNTEKNSLISKKPTQWSTGVAMRSWPMAHGDTPLSVVEKNVEKEWGVGEGFGRECAEHNQMWSNIVVSGRHTASSGPRRRRRWRPVQQCQDGPNFPSGGVWSSSFRGATTYLDRGLTTCPTLYNRHKTFKVNNCECYTHFTDLLKYFWYLFPAEYRCMKNYPKTFAKYVKNSLYVNFKVWYTIVIPYNIRPLGGVSRNNYKSILSTSLLQPIIW